MCGICGVMTDWMVDGDVKIFSELMHLNVLRGWEGAGAAIMNEACDNVQCVRTTQTGTDLILGQEFKKIIKDGPRKSLILGHCRYPTKGDNVIENVHPFECDHIVGVHNGTFRKIENTWFGKEESDSKAIFEDIAKRGAKAAIKDADGAYALVWIDKRERTLNFLRNNERPLYVWRSKTFMAWSSEKDDLEKILSRNGKRYQNSPDITYFAADKHYCIELPGSTPFNFADGGTIKPERSWEHSPFLDMWAEKGDSLESKKGNRKSNTKHGSVLSTNPNGDHGGHSNFNHANAAHHNGNSVVSLAGRNRNSSLAKHFPPARPPSPLIAEDEKDPDMYMTQSVYYVSRDRLLGYLKAGCEYCGEKADIEEYKKGETHWLTYSDFMCESCWNNPAALAEEEKYHPHLKNRRIQ